MDPDTTEIEYAITLIHNCTYVTLILLFTSKFDCKTFVSVRGMVKRNDHLQKIHTSHNLPVTKILEWMAGYTYPHCANDNLQSYVFLYVSSHKPGTIFYGVDVFSPQIKSYKFTQHIGGQSTTYLFS